MSKTIDNIDLDNSDLLPDNLLYEIFEVQYDDLFCKILKISEKSFSYFLQQQVIFNLLIIHKKVDPSILTAFQDLFFKRYKENVKTMRNNFEIIKNKEKNNDEDLIYLDITKCYIHCHKCYNIIHKCGNKLIFFDEHIYCIKCMNVYNKNQIMLFCPECKRNYYTKLRKPVFNNKKKFEKLFILRYKKYHCPSGKEEKIKCLKCSNNLYFRFIQDNQKNEDNINTIYCIKCKLKYNLKDVFFKCKICLKNFKCEARIYRDFPKKKKKLLFLIHTLLRNKNALPNLSLCEKQCNCDLKEVDEYKHNEDKGKYLEGIKNNKKSVICSICMKILEYSDVDWNCPKCGNIFKYSNKVENVNNSNVNLIKNNSNDNEISVFNNDNNLYNQYLNINDYFMKSEENPYRYTIKRINNNINTININNNSSLTKLKKIFEHKNEINTNYNKHSFIIVKSKSKNDILKNKNKKYNANYQEQILINNNINIIKEVNNEKEKEIEKEQEKVKEKEKEKVLNEKNNNLNEINTLPKKEKKKMDTRSIFNNIRNNIYNLDEFYPDTYIKKPQKKQVHASGRNVIIHNDFLEEKITQPIQEKITNNIYVNNKEQYNNEIFSSIDYIVQNNNKPNNENEDKIIQSRDYFTDNNLNFQSNKNIKAIPIIQKYEDIPVQNKKKKKHINYAKRIFFFNGKADKDCKSLDDNINDNNLNKYHTNNIFKKYMNNNNNEINNNNNEIINNSQYPYENEYFNINNENYYYNYSNYIENPNQQISLLNFNSENYSIIKLIGKGANGKIYLVQDLQTQQTFALKSMIIDNELELKEREEEYNLIYKMTYENPELKIINIYGIEIRKIDRYNMFLNVLMEKGDYDWETEIINRKKANNFYTEEELYYILANLVGTFAFLQQKGISHRDVKPQNILCFGKNEYKICDFGEAKYHKGKNAKKYGKSGGAANQTIRGTEMYMSPILFKAVQLKPDSLTKYNSYKSDVFSLGLCFLYASSLDSEILLQIREVFDMEKMGIIVNQYLSGRYSQEFINLLLYMLQVDENYRPDFIELNSWIVYENY